MPILSIDGLEISSHVMSLICLEKFMALLIWWLNLKSAYLTSWSLKIISQVEAMIGLEIFRKSLV